MRHIAQGTEQQLWAARELKAQNSRYHTAYQAWFNRASEPRVRAHLWLQPCLLAYQLSSFAPVFGTRPPESTHGLLDRPCGRVCCRACVCRPRSVYVNFQAEVSEPVAK